MRPLMSIFVSEPGVLCLKETDRLIEELSGRVKLTFFSLDTFLGTTVVFWIQLFDV